jgi:flagellar biosynthesis chaperone FliJ
MPFHFTLAPLLRLRESLEKAELQRLRMMAMQVAQARVEIEALECEIEAARRQVLEQTATGISGAELNMAALLEASRREYRSLVTQRFGSSAKLFQTFGSANSPPISVSRRATISSKRTSSS